MATCHHDGTAREVAPGRLAHFEDEGDPGDVELSLPPRRRRTTAATTPPVDPPVDPADTPPSAERPARPGRPRQLPTSVSRLPADAAETVAEAATFGAIVGVPAVSKGVEDKVRPSNVHIPVGLIEPIAAKCKAEGLSHGEVIISALEATYPRLPELVHPAATAGGSLFATRRSRSSRSAEGPLTPLNYRLRVADFATIDRLVTEFGASSRGHLITTALAAYFEPTPQP